MAIALSSTGEIGSFRDVDQFQPAKTQFACGYFSGAIIKAMAPVGQQPAQSVPQMIAEAEQWYAADHGSNAISVTDGMSLQEEHDLVTQRLGLHYQAVALDVNTVRTWIRAGYPIMLTISETSVLDMVLGRNPYPWNPSGTHIIVVSGVASDGNLLVRDPANCTNLYDPNSLRPGPRKYDAARLQIWTATVVVPSWRPRPSSDIPPTGEDMLTITDPFAAAHFKQIASNPDRWHCIETGQDLFAGILDGWCKMNGAPRLPKGGEVRVGQQAVYQECESGIVLYDPGHEFDAPSGPWAPCYLLKLDSPLAQKILAIAPPPAQIPAGVIDDLRAVRTSNAANDAAIAKVLADLGVS